MGKVYDNKLLCDLLKRILFGGERVPYNPDHVPSIDGEIYGFIKRENGAIVISNRIFEDIYEGKAEAFNEEEGRRRFLLFIRPIINGTGNYYIESRTRNSERMDIVIDYLGERFVVELKIWRGQAYHEKGEIQLADYLDYYRLDKGYMLTYNFNKKKTTEFTKKKVNEKTLIEAFV